MKKLTYGLITLSLSLILTLAIALVVPGAAFGTALSADKSDIQYSEGETVSIPVYQSTTLYLGALVMTNSSGYAIPGADTASSVFQGVNLHGQVDNSSGSSGDETVTVTRTGVFRMDFNTSISQSNVGDEAYLVDDQTVDLAGDTSNDIMVGVIVKYIDSDEAWVDIEPATKKSSVDTHIADTSAAHDADAIGYNDDDTHTTETDVDASLDEIYQHILSAQHMVEVDLRGALELDGTYVTAFSDGASTTPGLDVLGNEAIGLRWNNHANPDPVITNIYLPSELDTSKDVVVHVLAAKTGNTDADDTTFDVGAFFLTDGALYDADADAGGTTTAMTGDATAKTLQEETVTIAASDVAASPSVLTLTIQPTDGTLDTDDVVIVGVWLEYTPATLDS